ncbi:hypothetical protein CSIRO_3845 [Bradyrhizobiaceae bacterium SG-6C]|nr:hypothetical protein CSIRO_3845 [Bradyrhizobiaceae bacterium SG-6C]
MKVLLISYSFPPYNAIGAVRAVQLAAFLEDKGHDVRIVAGDQLPYPVALDMPPLKARIFRARFRNVEAPLNWARKFVGSGGSGAVGLASGARRGWMVKLVNLYRALFAIPDGQVGWYPAAMRAAKDASREWTPDVIVSSALPFTAHIVASRLAREIQKPWIAEYRDLFAGNPYSDLPRWRSSLDQRIEKAVLSSAAAIVAVTPHAADELRRVHHKPTHVVMNGFDAAEQVSALSPPNQLGRKLHVLYTGIIYPGRRDPTPLFQAMRLMGERGRRVTVAFYGQDLRGVREAAAEENVDAQVTINKPVSHSESLRLQRQADILLLLLWDDPRERGTITGKVFEYVGATRPILAIGCHDGIASTLVRNRGLGATASSPEAIASELNRWIEQIDASGTVPFVPASARKGLSRGEQFADYEKLLQSVAS